MSSASPAPSAVPPNALGGASPNTPANTPANGSLRAELARKTIHLASCAIPVAYAAGVSRPTMLTWLGALGVVALGVELARLRWAWVRALFVRAVGALLREHEHGGWSGATWLLAAYALSVVLFPRAIAVAAMLAAGLGDAAAAIVGRSVAAARARRGTPLSGGKTLAGSAACVIATFAGALLVASLSLVPAAAAALVASLAERVPLPIDDNVRVALGAGGAAWLAEAVIRAVA